MNQILLTLIKTAIAIFLLWLLTHTSKLDFSLLPNLVHSPSLLFLAASLSCSTVILSALRWYRLNKAQNINLSFRQTLMPTYIGIALNNLLPGGVGGDFFKFYFISKKIKLDRGILMLTILFDRITGLMGIFLAICIISIFHLNNFSQHKISLYFMLSSLALLLLALVFFLLSILLPKQLGLSEWLRKRFIQKKWITLILTFLKVMHVYRNSKLIILECLIISTFVQIIIAATCMLMAKMMLFPDLSFFDYIMAIAVTQIINLVPITPGGFGVGEVAFANILLLLNPGVRIGYATIYLAYRIVTLMIYLPSLSIFVFNNHLFKQQRAFNKENVF